MEENSFVENEYKKEIENAYFNYIFRDTHEDTKSFKEN
jgi:hypothetical protein